MIANVKGERRLRRKTSIRLTVKGTAARPRLSVYRSLKHIYAQVIDDARGETLAYASSLAGKGEGAPAGGGKKAKAKDVGARLAKQCLAKSIDKVVFDRNGFDYHGRVAAVAEGAREAGLKF